MISQSISIRAFNTVYSDQAWAINRAHVHHSTWSFLARVLSEDVHNKLAPAVRSIAVFITDITDPTNEYD